MKKLLREASEYLLSRGIRFPQREAEDILMDLLEISSRSALHQAKLSSEEQSLYWKRLRKRGDRCPTAYIHGKVHFLGVELQVTPQVLIPRQETEIFVEQIIGYLQMHKEKTTFYDVCCGSGCIGLAVRKHCPHVRVTLSDISPEALAIAESNARSNALAVDFLLGDLFDPFSFPADVLVCNPPYLSYKEFFESDPEVRCHEPWKALVGGVSGLEFYHRIATHIHKILVSGGVGWLEIGSTQGEDIKQIFHAKGIRGRVLKDYAQLDRFFFLENQANDAVSSGEVSGFSER
ncbi:peptide chain release factor N(5)-glutamine methyltransferase [Chlamydia trachomatis]|uniref:Release factor glutamine methyltransferase n=1 Tax=Chlamydia trachomatis serovar D (strain ATCC VR-885 / DSM 19411 / UW-3/Cx) TaxID=272561 RepID=PRMC_CHLTR|nr:peptide chain release factor N(5)-glutamine methyltransferase [Chlamydia trachomatis]NP_219526.1 release factor glutamine methyltransferase [Chlamydia trachomatis D/UW-3/CX]O84027.1 RecName: Full=Release factor glutamine methyltransferase; Short=RF MTase; AltName: Full=N5-glutamine methyltransferase PrmC; AltName: Full=Protein-(glutamine-N5) MTase PrmC; AltName: Full=Protein-glutamine N-methyltransferase PrmC [Chlamydia trachomatis D/UW-3/CX]AAC67614.1 N6-adenine-specific DNA methylase [Chlam